MSKLRPALGLAGLATSATPEFLLTVLDELDALHTLILCLALVAHAVIQALGRTELEDGTRTGVRLKRLHAHCGVCTSPTVMLNSLWGMTWLWGWCSSHKSHVKT